MVDLEGKSLDAACFARIVATTPDGIALVDHSYVYLIVNPTYLQWHRKTQEQIVGHTVQELLGDEVFFSTVKPQIDRGLAGQTARYEFWLPFNDGVRRFISVTNAPYIEDSGELTGVVVTVRDITALKEAKTLLARHAAREQTVNRVVQAIRSSLALDAVFSIAVQEVGKAVSATQTILARRQPQDKFWLHIAEYRADPMVPVSLGLRIPDDGNPVVEALLRGERVQLASTSWTFPLHRPCRAMCS